MMECFLCAENDLNVLNSKFCHNDNVRDIIPPNSKRHDGVIRGNFSMNIAPKEVAALHQKWMFYLSSSLFLYFFIFLFLYFIIFVF